MSRRRQTMNDNQIAQGIMLILLAGYGALARFWSGLTTDQKWIFGILSIGALVVFIVFIIMLFQYRKRKRYEAWQRAMGTVNRNISMNRAAEFPSAKYLPSQAAEFPSAKNLSPQALEVLAMQVYKQMGYRAILTGGPGDHGVDVRLIDPHGRVEIVQCKQLSHPVSVSVVIELIGSMALEEAEQGYLWAPGGFSSVAKQCAVGKPIMLLDNDDIDLLVESAYTSQ